MLRRLASSLLVLAALPFAAAQKPAESTLTFHFERPGLERPVYTLTLHSDGTGTYAATYSPAAAGAEPVEATRPITLSQQTTSTLFEHIQASGYLRGGCETHLKNIASSGAKTLSYQGPAGSTTCTYNYTDNKAIASVTETMQAVAETLDAGRSIDLKHRFDRLGLDHELSNLVAAVHDGRAVEVATIAPVLQSLLNDPQVMERVRKRAAGLLEATNVPPAR
jgi:hypothetical protein